jgi:hypothetical protein
MKRGKKRKEENEYYCLPIGIIPEWLLIAETGKGFWENLIPDKKSREEVLAIFAKAEVKRKAKNELIKNHGQLELF